MIHDIAITVLIDERERLKLLQHKALYDCERTAESCSEDFPLAWFKTATEDKRIQLQGQIDAVTLSLDTLVAERKRAAAAENAENN